MVMHTWFVSLAAGFVAHDYRVRLGQLLQLMQVRCRNIGSVQVAGFVGQKLYRFAAERFVAVKADKKQYVLEKAIPDEPPANATQAVKKAWEKHVDDSAEVSCLMLATMIPELQKNLEDLAAFDMITQLKEMFQEQARHERFETMKSLMGCQMQEGSSVSTHVLKMKSYIDQLERLGFPLSIELAGDMILNSLPKSFDHFILNYNMNGWEKSITELHKMLKTTEVNIPSKTSPVLMINEGRIKKPNNKGKNIRGKGKGKAKVVVPKQPSKKIEKDAKCFHCEEMGHWKRNCPKYLAELNKTKSSGASTSGIFGLKNVRELKDGEMELHVGNGAHVAVKAIGEYEILLPSGFYLKLDNAKPHNGIYEINVSNSCTSSSMYTMNTKRLKSDFSQSYLWHCRLGHISKKRMEKLQTDGIVEPTGSETFDTCESCLSGKMTKAPFLGVGEKATELLGFIHTDVCGPFKTMTRTGKRYFITFIDDFSRYGYVYLISHKHEAFEVFKTFQKEVENQLGKTIKAIRSDRGGKYLSYEFEEHLRQCGIVSQLTPPGTPQLNGVSERRNRTLLDMVRSMMSRTNLPHSFWGYALETAAKLVNIAPTKKVNKIPYEIWHGSKPKTSYLKVWGCDAYVKRETPNKLEPRGEKVVFVGYPKETMGYYFYQPDKNKVVIIRKGTFLEKEFLARSQADNIVDMEVIPEHNLRSSRDRRDPDRYGFFIQGNDVPFLDGTEPTNYKTAISDLESDKWLDAMGAEMQSMHDNQVWDLVDLPPNCKTVGSKWVFMKKTDMDGNVHTFKARLVAKSFTQTQGIDYEETFSPVAMLKSIRILIAISAYYDYEIWQMDVKTAFLNGHLIEDVYMAQPEGFVDPKNPNKVCKLKKSIYGLKQAYRSWNLRFDEKIKEFGFLKNEDEPCVYMKASGSIVMFLILYVDDILLIGNDIPTLNGVKSWSFDAFQCKMPKEVFYLWHMGRSYGTSDAAKEAAWMKKFIADLGVVPSIARPIEVMCDNSGAIAQAKEPRSHHSTKHILRKFHYIREILERGDITINKVHTDHNLADPFTKPMPQAKHEEHARNIGLRFASDWI
ncbi:hypothetical protein E3N88_06229 [Mikania micrantha]|uniref:Integrase catalytic domain-containing protein n=1 Tax=Mikania micrantha TaxID=192012 RepID=A0A5N6PN75_9ASTR|nr:hypothetical protein E3N88_06229 [Mikania micrantha]